MSIYPTRVPASEFVKIFTSPTDEEICLGSHGARIDVTNFGEWGRLPAMEDKLCSVFAGNFATRGEIGASVSVWRDGQEIVSLHSGTVSKDPDAAPWTADTLIPIWSATKGLAAACCLRALHTEGYDLEMAVAELWPEFAGGGKRAVTIGQALSHSAGLSGLDEKISITDYRAVIEGLERQTPSWLPGTAHGYHPRTFGFLAEEMLRRVTGAENLNQYFRQEIAEPLDLDLWIGLPEPEHHRVATLYPGRFTPSDSERRFYDAFNATGNETRRAFTSPVGLNSIADMNTPAGWTAGIASMGGVGNVQSLGKFYSCLATGGGDLFDPKVIGWMAERRTTATEDRTLLAATAFSAGFMVESPDSIEPLFGPTEGSFGHPGAGGSHAFADPENRLAFAYAMNQMEVGALPNRRSLDLVDALYSV